MPAAAMDRFYLSKTIFSVSIANFADAVAAVDTRLAKAAKAQPKLTISFYKAAGRTSEVPEMSIPELLGTTELMDRRGAQLWKQANLVVAEFAAAGTHGDALTACITYNRLKDRKALRFNIAPHHIGEAVGREILNNEPRFILWSRGLL